MKTDTETPNTTNEDETGTVKVPQAVKPAPLTAAEAEKVIAAENKRVEKIAKSEVTDDGAKLGKMLTAFKGKVAKIIHDMNVVAASCIAHAIKHGNITPMNQMLDIMMVRETPFRTNALRAYFIAKGPCDWDEEAKTLVYNRDKAKSLKRTYNKDRIAFCSALVREPFYKFAPEAPFVGMNLREQLVRLTKRAHNENERMEKARKEGREIEQEPDLEGIELLDNLVKNLPAANEQAA